MRRSGHCKICNALMVVEMKNGVVVKVVTSTCGHFNGRSWDRTSAGVTRTSA